jgi:predicted MarR family transcription regulator
MKNEPYMVTIDDIHDVTYTLDELQKKFRGKEEKKEVKETKQYTSTTPSQFYEIEKLDIQDVVVRAFRSI